MLRSDLITDQQPGLRGRHIPRVRGQSFRAMTYVNNGGIGGGGKSKTIVVLKDPLPPRLRTFDAGTHLYRIGASYTQYPAGNTELTRYWLHWPALQLSLIVFICARTLIVLLVLPANLSSVERIYWGDVPSILRLRLHASLLFLTYDYQIFLQHLLHWVSGDEYLRHGGYRPFDLTSGRVTPWSMRLYNRRAVQRFAMLSRTATPATLFLTRYVMNPAVGLAFFISFAFQLYQMTSEETSGGWLWAFCLFVQVPIWTAKSHIFFTYFCFHMLHFFLICSYLRQKLANPVPRDRPLQVGALLGAMYSQAREIRLHNGRFWSRFIFIVYTSHLVNICVFLYCGLFGEVPPLIRVIIFMVTALETGCVMALCWIASSVYTRVKNAQKTLASWYVRRTTLPTPNQMPLDGRCRVKLTTCIEVWADVKKLCFTCWFLFPINYFTFYELVALVTVLFLRQIQTKLNGQTFGIEIQN